MSVGLEKKGSQEVGGARDSLQGPEKMLSSRKFDQRRPCSHSGARRSPCSRSVHPPSTPCPRHKEGPPVLHRDDVAATPYSNGLMLPRPQPEFSSAVVSADVGGDVLGSYENASNGGVIGLKNVIMENNAWCIVASRMIISSI